MAYIDWWEPGARSMDFIMVILSTMTPMAMVVMTIKQIWPNALRTT